MHGRCDPTLGQASISAHRQADITKRCSCHRAGLRARRLVAPSQWCEMRPKPRSCEAPPRLRLWCAGHAIHSCRRHENLESRRIALLCASARMLRKRSMFIDLGSGFLSVMGLHNEKSKYQPIPSFTSRRAVPLQLDALHGAGKDIHSGWAIAGRICMGGRPNRSHRLDGRPGPHDPAGLRRGQTLRPADAYTLLHKSPMHPYATPTSHNAVSLPQPNPGKCLTL